MFQEPDEASKLRQCIGDLEALATLPALCVGRTPHEIVDCLADALTTALRVELVYIRVSCGGKSDWIETVRTDGVPEGRSPQFWFDLLRPSSGPADVPLAFLDRTLPVDVVPFEYRSVAGIVVVGALRDGFPDDNTGVLCRVAARQAAMALYEADMLLRLDQTMSTLTSIMENSAACVFHVDAEERCTFMNATAERVLGYTENELRGKVLHDVIHHTDPDGLAYPAEERPFAAFHGAGKPIVAREDVLTAKDGTPIPVLCAASPILSDGRRIATIVEAYDISKRKRAERDSLAQARRENLTSRIGLAIRSSLDPGDIERTAVDLLGEALGADRCFYAHIDIANDTVRFGAEWRRPDLPSLQGEQKLSLFNVDLNALFGSHQSLVVNNLDAGGFTDQTRSVMEAMHVRAWINVPLYRDNTLVALLSPTKEFPHVWTRDEIALAEAVAAQTRTAIEAASVVQREHTIATTLQDALLPPLPTNIPGLELASHYQAALGESNIGGDFYAAYPIGNARYALVVGDVSGKGLAAASQVAAIQNMLRYALSVTKTVSVAVTEMNAIFSSQNLLAGFATLFVGVYDAGSRTLTYVSCGHEPGLIRRASGHIEELWTCGPPLGVAANFEYREQSVRFQIGDSIFLYTDGLSEAGVDRKHLLGLSGLASILTRCDASSPDAIVHTMVDQAGRFALGQFRDDVCVLAATVRDRRIRQPSHRSP